MRRENMIIIVFCSVSSCSPSSLSNCVYRGRGFTTLKGVTDTRGERGIVAVAERGGGRVRLLHYAPALPPFYQTELTHLHRLV